jgi:threonine/homoserine/homoserine lactone efflux protein|tara:strand:- start:62 stop:682 length:621 start_codon:yes stop_codon:yes gene_type:complete
MLEYFLPLLMICCIQSGTPGPNNIMLTASGKNFGYIRTIPHMMGVVIGFLSLIIFLSLGLIAIFNEYPLIQTALQLVGSIYLLYLAYRIFFSVNSFDESKSKPITFIESSLFQYVNPKGVMMAITTISIYTDTKNFYFIDTFNQGIFYILIAFTISNILAVLTWTSVGVFLNNFIKSDRSIKLFNGFMSILLVLTIIWINYEFYGN